MESGNLEDRRKTLELEDSDVESTREISRRTTTTTQQTKKPGWDTIILSSNTWNSNHVPAQQWEENQKLLDSINAITQLQHPPFFCQIRHQQRLDPARTSQASTSGELEVPLACGTNVCEQNTVANFDSPRTAHPSSISSRGRNNLLLTPTMVHTTITEPHKIGTMLRMHQKPHTSLSVPVTQQPEWGMTQEKLQQDWSRPGLQKWPKSTGRSLQPI